MKKAIRIILPLLVLYFLITWALAAVSLQKGFGRRDQIPQKEPVYTDQMQSAYPREEVTFSPAGTGCMAGSTGIRILWMMMD